MVQEILFNDSKSLFSVCLVILGKNKPDIAVENKYAYVSRVIAIPKTATTEEFWTVAKIVGIMLNDNLEAKDEIAIQKVKVNNCLSIDLSLYLIFGLILHFLKTIISLIIETRKAVRTFTKTTA